MDCVLATLKTEVDTFDWDIVQLAALDYKQPQERNRVFLRGILKRVSRLPAVLPSFRAAHLRDVLNLELPHTARHSIPEGKRTKMLGIETQLQVQLRRDPDKYPQGSIACVAIDRAEGRVWNQRITINKTCTLTTANSFLFLLSLNDLDLPESEREVFRWLHPGERLVLQGLRASAARYIPYAKIQEAAGNMYPVPMLTAVLAPMLDAIANSEQGTNTGLKVPTLASTRILAIRRPKTCPMRIVKKPMKSMREKHMKPIVKKRKLGRQPLIRR